MILRVPPKNPFKRFLLETPLWQYAMSSSLKSPPEGLKNAVSKKGMPPVRPPIPYVPPTDLHEKQETEQIKVKLPGGTKFQMPTYGSGNNEEYLIHIIAVLRLVEQKGTAAEVKEAFAVLVKVRKEMSPIFNFPEDKTVAKKEARKKKLSDLNESFKAKKSFTVEQAQKAYKLFRCFILGEAQTQWDRIVNKMHTKNPWIGMNGKSNKGICMKSWISFMDLGLHWSFFPLDIQKTPIRSSWKFYLFALVFRCILPFLVEFPKLRVGERGFLARLLAKITRRGRKSLHS
jgi:hypothetical protein